MKSAAGLACLYCDRQILLLLIWLVSATISMQVSRVCVHELRMMAASGRWRRDVTCCWSLVVDVQVVQ